MKYASARLFRLKGVPVYAHITWTLFVAGLIVWAGYEEKSLGAALWAGALLSMLFGSALMHEYAHAFAACALGYRVRRIVLLPIACLTELRRRPKGGHEFAIALAGPLANLVVAAILSPILFAQLRHHGHIMFLSSRAPVRSLVSCLCAVNLWLGCINLLPCFPLDGGRMVRSLLAVSMKRFAGWRRGAHEYSASRIAIQYISLPISLILALVCVRQRDWFDLFSVCLMILAGQVEMSEEWSVERVRRRLAGDPEWTDAPQYISGSAQRAVFRRRRNLFAEKDRRIYSRVWQEDCPAPAYCQDS